MNSQTPASQDASRQIEALFAEHRPRLKRMIAVRLDPKVRRRVDESDVLQDAYLEAARRLDKYLEDPPMPFFLWLRWITAERIAMCHRAHLRAEKRTAARERPLAALGARATSESLALQLVGATTTPSKILMQREMIDCIEQLMHGLDPLDYELLVLRHFEQLTNQEAARALGMNPSSASSRYLRALEKLQAALAEVPGFSEVRRH